MEEMKVVAMVEEMAGSLVEMRVVKMVAWMVELMADCLVYCLVAEMAGSLVEIRVVKMVA